MTQVGLQILDLTYPITSMFSGKQFNKTIRETFGENIKIEDFCKKSLNCDKITLINCA